jgi:pyruvate/2-oxoglutarate dehydrogenase complex dihydrolipoamide acyltransferase (E2) component
MKVRINDSGRLVDSDGTGFRVFSGEEIELPDQQARELISRGEAVEILAEAPVEAQAADVDDTVDAGDQTANATAAAEKLARELGIDLAIVQGSGKDGLITKADVAAAAAEKP